MDWITGQRFESIADFTYSPIVKARDDYDKLPNTFDFSKLRDKNIVYTHTMYVKSLFQAIEACSHTFVIVTHNSDVNITDSFKPPENVLKWHSQNVNVINDKITSLPIGLENDRWFRGVHKKDKMLAKLKEKKHHRNVLYVNHNIATYPEDRLKPYQLFEGKHWATIERGVNGKGFDEYLDNLYNHRYVICPRGNGMDTRRFWECL